ncbi:MAG: hypothetical protein J7647_21710 [Cyanobacteria bacterium SBLK]|nr:hypothetical protein [Cyanobacteria bacterium SBLK]
MKETFNISPLIRIALIFLYLTLTIPLPFLSATTDAPISPQILWAGIIFGLSVLYGALSEQVILNEETIQVKYPIWFPPFFRKGWLLKWEEIQELKLRTTGQGGLVYYFVTESRDRAYLLPMRVAGFARLTRLVEEKTGIDTRDVRPLSQPWMYLILLVVTLLLFLVDAWTIWTATHLG